MSSRTNQFSMTLECDSTDEGGRNQSFNIVVNKKGRHYELIINKPGETPTICVHAHFPTVLGLSCAIEFQYGIVCDFPAIKMYSSFSPEPYLLSPDLKLHELTQIIREKWLNLRFTLISDESFVLNDHAKNIARNNFSSFFACIIFNNTQKPESPTTPIFRESLRRSGPLLKEAGERHFSF